MQIAVQRAYERVPHPSGSNWQGGDRNDPVQARNLREDRALDALRAIEKLEEQARRIIGAWGVAFLAGILSLACDQTSRGRRARPQQKRGSAADPRCGVSTRSARAEIRREPALPCIVAYGASDPVAVQPEAKLLHRSTNSSTAVNCHRKAE
jgi:hypothetical protein